MAKPFDLPTVLVNFDRTDDPEADFRSLYSCPVNYCNLLAERNVLILPALPIGLRKDVLLALVDMADGFLFIGGADYPSSLFGREPDETEKPMNAKRAENDLELFNLAWASNKPIFGICAGMQLAVLAHGGRLVADLPAGGIHRQIDRTRDSMHAVRIIGGKLKAVLGSEAVVVNSSHHQGVRPEEVPADKLMITALAPDGVVEAVERRSKGFGLFVQWHPERHPSPEHRARIFDAFVKAVKVSFRRRSKHGREAGRDRTGKGRHNRFRL